MIGAAECQAQLQGLLPGLFERTGRLTLRDVTVDPLPANGRLDLMATVEVPPQRTWVLLFAVQSNGQPRYVRMAVEELRAAVGERAHAYGVFCAPYVSPAGAEVCRRNGLGFIDLAGNCLLCFDGVYLDIQGRPNPYPNTRPLKSLFAPKSSRAVRVLLSHPGRAWQVQELAGETALSLGQASQVKQRLGDYELIEPAGRAFQLTDYGRLLEAWAENYSYTQNDRTHYYSLEDPPVLEQRLGAYCADRALRYGLTLFSGAARVAPFTRYSQAFAYVEAGPEEIAAALDCKEVSSGPTLTLLQPYDEGVFYGLQEREGLTVMSDVQLYLDLQSYPGRGPEAAAFLRQQRMEPTWPPAPTTSPTK